MAYTGACRSEVVSLRVSDVDFNRRLILLHGKGQKDRMIRLHDRLITPLRLMCTGKASGNSVFVVSIQVVCKEIRKLSKRVGLDGFNSHSLRHYFCITFLIKRS